MSVWANAMQENRGLYMPVLAGFCGVVLWLDVKIKELADIS